MTARANNIDSNTKLPQVLNSKADITINKNNVCTKWSLWLPSCDHAIIQNRFYIDMRFQNEQYIFRHIIPKNAKKQTKFSPKNPIENYASIQMSTAKFVTVM